jgi:hypothetical protein
MKIKYPRLWISLAFLLGATLACNFNSGSTQPDQQPTTFANEVTVEDSSSPLATPIQSPAADPSSTPIANPTQKSTPAFAATIAPEPTDAPFCSTLVNLKVRKGPGTAYDPPLTAVEPGTQLTPFGFNPVGIPGGSWALVSSADGAFTGWVSASSDFIACNIDLSSLPSVEVAPPPPTAIPTLTKTPATQGSAPKVSNNGGFGDCPLNLTCDDSFSSESLSAVNAHSTDSNTNGDGVDYVIFSIWDSNESVKFYERTEKTPLYCTFGGNGPCNGWTYEAGAFRWSSGGDPVEPGDYVVIMTIKGTTPDENGNDEGQLRHFFRITAP